MALFFPSLEQIRHIPDKPTEGEWYLLHFLADILDDRYEVYFQPHLCGSQPDVIIMLKGGGVLIIEVKDWNLSLYEYLNENNWAVWDNYHEKNQLIRSPLRQVKHYKNELIDYHVPGMLEKKLKNEKLYAVISTMVYFHKSCDEEILSVVSGCLSYDESYTHLVGRDTLNEYNFKNILSKCYMRYANSKLFDDEIYHSFRLILQPMEYYESVGQIIEMSPEQNNILNARNRQLKVCGAAGSGKTQLMAKMAVNEAVKNKEVLILTFNITLRWYIGDMLRKVCSAKEWKFVKHRVTICHYHVFLWSYFNESEMPIIRNEEIDKLRIINIPESKRKKYDAVFLDEIQDFKKDWVLDARAVLAENGKFACFGDAGQNIYGNDMSKYKGPYTGIIGRWRVLKGNYRLTTEISNLAAAFQREFIIEKYGNDVITPLQMELPLGEGTIGYIYKEEGGADEVEKYIGEMITRWKIHQNDICVLDDRFEELRIIDNNLREDAVRTSTVFETKEQYEEMLNKKMEKKDLKKKLNRIRRSKKFNFYMNTGKMKLCSIQSFKGWEITNLILVLHDDKNNPYAKEEVFPELIYTAITRCRRHLLIVNLGCSKYHKFFSREIESLA